MLQRNGEARRGRGRSRLWHQAGRAEWGGGTPSKWVKRDKAQSLDWMRVMLEDIEMESSTEAIIGAFEVRPKGRSGETEVEEADYNMLEYGW